MNRLKCYVVQFCGGGVPDEPQVFLVEQEMLECWESYVEKGYIDDSDPSADPMESEFLVNATNQYEEVRRWEFDLES